MIPHPARAAAAALAVAVATLLAACDDGPAIDVEQYLTETARYLDEGQYRAGIIQAKNVIKEAPENARARLLLGRMLLEQGNAAAAEIELTRAQSLGSDKDAVLPWLGRAQLAQGKFDDAQKLADPDAFATTAGKAAAHVIRANVLLARRQPDKAREEFLAARLLAPGDTAIHVGLARMALRDRDLEAAARHLADADKAAPDDIDVIVLRADLALARSDFATALAEYEKAKARRPENLFPLIGLARAQMGLKDLDGATANLDAALKRAPKHAAALLLRATIAYQKKDFTHAESLANTLLAVVPDDLPGLLIAGSAAYALQHDEQAVKHLSGFVAARPDHVPARKMYGAALMRLGDGAQALKVLEPLGKSAGDDAQFLSLLGAAAVRSRDLEKGAAYLAQAAEINPDDAASQARFGATQIGLGKIDAGIAALEKALELDPTLDQATYALFTTYMRQKQYDKALEIAAKVKAEKPDRSIGHSMEGVVMSAKGDAAASRAAFNRALEVDPKSIDARVNLAALEVRAGDVDAARKQLEAAQEHYPDNLQVMLRLAAVEGRAGKMDKAGDWLEKAVKAHPDALAPRVLLARLYVATRQPDKALAVTRPAIEANPDNPALLKVTGQAHMTANRPRDAAVVFRKLATQEPKSLEAHFLLAGAYRVTGNDVRYMEELNAILALDPDNKLARLALIRAKMDQGHLAEARQDLAKVKEANPDLPPVYELEGRLLVAEKRYDDAVAAFRKTMSLLKGPNRAMTMLLAKTQLAGGHADAAAATLESWMKERPKDYQVLFELGNYYLRTGRGDDAAAAYGRIVEAEPKHWAARNNLAWVQMTKGDLDAAQSQIETALETAGEQPEVLDTAGLVYLAKGESRQAVRVLRKATGLQSGRREGQRNLSIDFHLAKALAEDGLKEEARSVLRKLLAAKDPFPERTEAEALKAKLGG
ncbi:MAG: PEP-CTERM system TPR-repeat protein PrsT [Hyphomicrobiales bacterium]|nr:PEP-CTERM system TPR-repeat protein PrsT [Hyphomicrobiales bacterium]MCP5374248.1 PEP-CTERM system TPR-repeat protein PrsT [Hyphomicrobiales bacterium]